MRRQHNLPKRLLALFLASVTLLSLAMPSFAMEDLSDIGDLPEITDIGGEIIDMSGSDITVTPTDPEWSDDTSSDSSQDQDDPAEDNESLPPVREPESSSSESEDGSLPAEDQVEAASEPDADSASGLDPPDSFSFAAEMEGVAYRSNSGTTIYLQKDSSIQHMYPFTGGNMQPAYIFTTADGQAAYCIEPARWNSVNGDVVTGSQTFSGLSQSKQNQIARAIAASGGSASNHAYYMACQAIIWEIAYGQSHGSGSVYSAVIAANASKLSSAYHDILSKMEAGGEIPSFMSPDPQNPTQHNMTENGGSYSIDLTNSNASVKLNAGDFKSKAPFKFSVSGDTLTVSSSSAPDQDAYVEWHSNEQSGSGLIFWSGGRQAKATLVGGSVPGDGYMAFFDDFLPPPPDDGGGGGGGGGQEEPGLGYLTIYKYDGKTNLPLAGAIFKIESPEYVNDAWEIPYGERGLHLRGRDSLAQKRWGACGIRHLYGSG